MLIIMMIIMMTITMMIIMMTIIVMIIMIIIMMMVTMVIVMHIIMLMVMMTPQPPRPIFDFLAVYSACGARSAFGTVFRGHHSAHVGPLGVF